MRRRTRRRTTHRWSPGPARSSSKWLGDAGGLRLTHDQGIDRARVLVRVREQDRQPRSVPALHDALVDELGEGIVLVLRVVPEVRHVLGADDR